MEYKNLNKSIEEIFQSDYIVPLYQRNYAWGEQEINQLLQDIYECFKRDESKPYFIGTLVVLRRKNGDFEVIDGQQRLTILSLIIKLLDPENRKYSKLNFDSRPEIESFLSVFYQRGEIETTTTQHLTSHFKEAVEFIKTTELSPGKDDNKRFQDLLESEQNKDFKLFKDYFFNNVQIVRVEIPQDTDVAKYFEIMNNRGEQLEQHEIVKARLLEKIDKNSSVKYAKIWDACSQMNIPIQRLFNKDKRSTYFSENYEDFSFEIDIKEGESEEEKESLNINQILNGQSIISDAEEKAEPSLEEKYEAVIDYPNFLMQVLKLYLRDEVDENDIPLNGDEILGNFEKYKAKINSKEFIKHLLFYRIVFDRFVVKLIEDEKAEDLERWILRKPKKDRNGNLYYVNTFGQDDGDERDEYSLQNRIIKCLSFLQVTFRTKKYKNWLQELFSWFDVYSQQSLQIHGEDFLNNLHQIVWDNYNRIFGNTFDDDKIIYSEGTKTPHFLFNFIDYLYWLDDKKNGSGTRFNFEFRYRNSVEHHLPQSFKNENNSKEIDNLGNLCLVSKGGNSRLNNESPKGKADEEGKFYRDNLPPKRKVMYNLTNDRGAWGEREINEHYEEVVKLINRRGKILKIKMDNKGNVRMTVN